MLYKLSDLSTACPAPMVYFNCSNAGPGAKGAECERSCKTLHMACVSAGVVPFLIITFEVWPLCPYLDWTVNTDKNQEKRDRCGGSL